MKFICSLLLAFNAVLCSLENGDAKPASFLHIGSSDELNERNRKLLARVDVEGAQIMYSWKSLEIEKDRYNFSQIELDLQILSALNKKLFLQIQDRFFEPKARNIPAYLLNDPIYGGGLVRQHSNSQINPDGIGWVTQQWNPHVRARYQNLLKTLATQYDGKVFGLILPETSTEIDMDKESNSSGFSCEKYFNAEMENLAVARSAFKSSHVVQYVNFFPCEWKNSLNYMSRMFEFAANNDVGLGGPDIVPYKKEQMENSYSFFHKYKGQLQLVAMAVQDPTLTYLNPTTNNPFTKQEFIDFAENYLSVDIIFWSISTPFLNNEEQDLRIAGA